MFHEFLYISNLSQSNSTPNKKKKRNLTISKPHDPNQQNINVTHNIKSKQIKVYMITSTFDIYNMQ